MKSLRPGEFLRQDACHVGRLKNVGRVYMHTVVDTYSNYGFGYLHTAKVPEAAVAVLQNDVFPFIRKNRSIFSHRQWLQMLQNKIISLRALS